MGGGVAKGVCETTSTTAGKRPFECYYRWIYDKKTNKSHAVIWIKNLATLWGVKCQKKTGNWVSLVALESPVVGKKIWGAEEKVPSKKQKLKERALKTEPCCG